MRRLKDSIARSLGRVAKLDPANPFDNTKCCKVCGAPAVAFDAVDFNKYCATEDYYEFGFARIPVVYWRCVLCSFVFTDFFDDWTPSEFSQYIYNDDYIKVDGEYAEIRPNRMAEEYARRLHLCRNLRILDYGSGAGVFVNRMRAAGFTAIEGYDPFSSPRRPQGKFDIITCFEVIEHTPDPQGSFADMCGLLAESGFIVFSQTVQPLNLSAIRGSWWYLAPRNGHISTYSEESLFVLARQLGMTMHRSSDLYAFVRGQPRHEVREALHTVGPPFWTTRVFAPSGQNGEASAAWHAVERAQIWSYRWSAAAVLRWQVRWDIAGEIQFRIPFRQQVRPGFAAESRVLLNGAAAHVLVERGDIVAEFNVPRGGHGWLELHTPPPERPVAAGNTRPIGLAVLTGYPSPSAGAEPPAPEAERAASWSPRRLLQLLRI
jgi:2-polyprenyl-6-hydroxyphenyl methylase/3-demethylubiquinone-9 3-methyltransferase